MASLDLVTSVPRRTCLGSACETILSGHVSANREGKGSHVCSPLPAPSWCSGTWICCSVSSSPVPVPWPKLCRCGKAATRLGSLRCRGLALPHPLLVLHTWNCHKATEVTSRWLAAGRTRKELVLTAEALAQRGGPDPTTGWKAPQHPLSPLVQGLGSW